LMAFFEALGRQAERGLKRPRERLLGFITSVQGNLHNGAFGVAQQKRGALEAQAFDVRFDRFADETGKHPMKVKARKARHSREGFDREVAIQMVMDVIQDQSDAIEIPRRHAYTLGAIEKRFLTVLARLTNLCPS
jgi:hypothetical protein